MVDMDVIMRVERKFSWLCCGSVGSCWCCVQKVREVDGLKRALRAFTEVLGTKWWESIGVFPVSKSYVGCVPICSPHPLTDLGILYVQTPISQTPC